MTVAVPEPEPSREVARADTDSWTEVIADVSRFATVVADTEFVPRGLRNNPAAVTAAIIYGREVGLPPMTSLTQTHVIEGKPALSAEAKRALVLAAGHEIEVLESTTAVCRMRSRRRGSERWSAEVVWTIDMARAAGLLNKSNWRSYPRPMLTARCSGELCDRDFPDVVFGFRTVEDLEDLGEEETGPAEQTTTRVTRQRTAAKKAPASLPAPRAPQDRPAAPAGPPLPGEDGYDGPTGRGAETGKGKAGKSAAGEGSTSEPAADGDQAEPEAEPEEQAGPPGEDARMLGLLPEEGADDVEDAVVVEDPPAEEPEPQVEQKPRGRASAAQKRMLLAQLGHLDVDTNDRDERLRIVSLIVGVPVASTSDLTTAQASSVIDTLGRCERDRAKLDALLVEAQKHYREEQS